MNSDKRDKFIELVKSISLVHIDQLNAEQLLDRSGNLFDLTILCSQKATLI